VAMGICPVTEEDACEFFASTTAFRALMQDELRKLAVDYYRAGKVTLYERGGAMGYIMCRGESACSMMWRFQLRVSLQVSLHGAGGGEESLSAAAAPRWKLLVEVSGQHGTAARVVRGESVTKRRQARAVAGMTPSQGMASLVYLGLSADMFPKVSTFVGARKAKLGSGSVSSSSMAASAGSWAMWLRQRSLTTLSMSPPSLLDWVYLPARWPLSPDDELLPLSLMRSMGPVAEGACVMLNQAMISMVQNIVQAGGVGQSGHGALVMDLSFKLNASGFGLAGMAVPSKHLHQGCWRTESILLGFGLRASMRLLLLLFCVPPQSAVCSWCCLSKQCLA